MNIFTQLRHDINDSFRKLYADSAVTLDNVNIEIPKDLLNGDLSSNIAMILAPKLSLHAREVAVNFKEQLCKMQYIAHVEVAGPGFINFTIKASVWQSCIKDILEDPTYFNQLNIGKNRKINIEYVSANPTGPMHIGHARGAVYGDVLANILTKCSYEVTREYYVNDAGSQIDNLVSTAFLRYKEIVTKQKIEIAEGLYPGEYLIPVGQDLAEEYGEKLLNLPEKERRAIIKKLVIGRMLELIKNDLKELGITHDIFTSEQELHDKNAILNTIEKLQKNGLVYEGRLPPPKGQVDENWEDRLQLLFKATDFGDDQDRPLQKADGGWTYLAADIAYAENKISRNFNELVYVLGADHGGYVKRINAIVEALSESKVKSAVKICQLVNFVKDGKPFKMSKRQGNFTTVRDVIDAVGSDIIRFMMISRKNDTVLEFDLEKVRQQTRENPVFYVQYAHVRAISIIENAKERSGEAHSIFIKNEYDLSLLSSEKEIQIIRLLACWSKILEASANYFEPHRLSIYLLDIASKFHALWNLSKENNDYRFILENDIPLTAARLALASAIQKVIFEGLKVMGIRALMKM